MSRLVEDVLDFSAARGGLGLALRPVATDLGLLARRALQELDGGGAGQLALALEGDLTIEGDADRLMQVLCNLTGNALQHGEGSPVRVEVRDRGEELQIEVRNGGAPIPPERLATLFEPFHRGDERRGSRSLGLGLYIVQEIVRAHAGRVAARSDEAGTVFEVVLPRRSGRGASPAAGG